jgi:hypothetical protein
VPAKVTARVQETLDLARAIAAEKGVRLEHYEAVAVVMYTAMARMKKKLAALEGGLH